MKVFGVSVVSVLGGMFLLLGSATTVRADESLSVTVTPPLFQLTIGPGESWTSALKVVNSNSYDVTYYAEPMDFSAQGEGGAANITPVVNDLEDPAHNSYSLAQWIQISPDPVVIKKGSSGEIPFTVHIPANAEPGGHYAAILVGTRPPSDSIQGASVKISSYVSSLLFVRVEGEINESARIREFRTENTLYQKPEADFLLRFENLGNSHLKPQGIITIYNMWGKKRGELLINQASNFGNVLPKSVRKFEFSWSADNSLFDIGEYSAVATLSFGEGNKQNISATTYFWVVPVVPVAITLTTVILFVSLLAWFIRRYVRRALALESKRHSGVADISMPVTAEPEKVYSLSTLIEPIREGVIDLRRVSASTVQVSEVERVGSGGGASGEKTISSAPLPMTQFLKTYRIFFLFVFVVIVGAAGAYLFFVRVLVPERSYEITDVSASQEAQLAP